MSSGLIDSTQVKENISFFSIEYSQIYLFWYYNMTVRISEGSGLIFAKAAGLNKLHMPIVK